MYGRFRLGSEVQVFLVGTSLISIAINLPLSTSQESFYALLTKRINHFPIKSLCPTLFHPSPQEIGMLCCNGALKWSLRFIILCLQAEFELPRQPVAPKKQSSADLCVSAVYRDVHWHVTLAIYRLDKVLYFDQYVLYCSIFWTTLDVQQDDTKICILLRTSWLDWILAENPGTIIWTLPLFSFQAWSLCCLI